MSLECRTTTRGFSKCEGSGDAGSDSAEGNDGPERISADFVAELVTWREALCSRILLESDDDDGDAPSATLS